MGTILQLSLALLCLTVTTWASLDSSGKKNLLLDFLEDILGKRESKLIADLTDDPQFKMQDDLQIDQRDGLSDSFLYKHESQEDLQVDKRDRKTVFHPKHLGTIVSTLVSSQ